MSIPTSSLIDKKRSSLIKRFYISALISLVFGVGVFFGVRFGLVPYLFMIDEDFSYRADLLSLDNFYDEDKRSFVGDERSVTTFGYDSLGSDLGLASISSFFDLRTVTGESIISLDRVYTVDPYTWQHQGKREGSLFAPRNLRKGESFTYWHVNYDTPLTMHYESEELIDGVKAYRYSTSFGVDQTDSLHHLPGVPEERGVSLDASLTLWVEPITGWLIHYRDEAIAYYYNIETGERLAPWNKFSNRYRFSSITKQASRAWQRSFYVRILEVVVPIWLSLISFGFLTRRLKTRSRKYLIGFFLLASIILVFWMVLPILFDKSDVVTIGVSRWAPLGNEDYDNNISGFKDALTQAGYAEDDKVKYYLESAKGDLKTQAMIASRFLELGVDLVFSQTTPGTQILKEKILHRPIVFSIVTYPVESGLIKSLKSSENNLVGTRNWVSMDDQLEPFLQLVPNTKRIGFIRNFSENNSESQLREMREVAEEMGITVVDLGVNSIDDLPGVLDGSLGVVDALYASCDTLVQSIGEEMIIDFAHRNSLPILNCNESGVRRGGLMGVVADFYDIGRLSGEKAVQILEGVPPSALETNTVARPFMYINVTTADRLGISIPQKLHARAKEIVR